jgi:hypothetical protein
MISIRRLAALDIAFLRKRLILAEFALGAFGSAALGVFTLLRSHSRGATIFGLYLVSLKVNYMPLLLHALSIAPHGTAMTEIAGETEDRRQLFRKYRRGSLILLIPFVVPIVAVAQWRRADRSS